MKRTIFCKHYTGYAVGPVCAAGVPYDSVMQGKGTPQMSLPCVEQARKPRALPCHCDKQDMPTQEELDAEDAAFKKMFENIKTAREAIVSHLGGPWKRGMPTSRGVITCPICGKENSLHYSRAGYNGHIHAMCKTDGCVSWME